jgi:hypothetical protein
MTLGAQVTADGPLHPIRVKEWRLNRQTLNNESQRIPEQWSIAG